MLMWRLHKISIMPTVRQYIFLLRKIPIVGIPTSTVIVIVFRLFMWPLSLRNVEWRSIVQLQCFKMVSQKNTISSYKVMMDNGTTSLSSDSTMASKGGKFAVPSLKLIWKCIVILLKIRMCTI